MTHTINYSKELHKTVIFIVLKNILLILYRWISDHVRTLRKISFILSMCSFTLVKLSDHEQLNSVEILSRLISHIEKSSFHSHVTKQTFSFLCDHPQFNRPKFWEYSISSLAWAGFHLLTFLLSLAHTRNAHCKVYYLFFINHLKYKVWKGTIKKQMALLFGCNVMRRTYTVHCTYKKKTGAKILEHKVLLSTREEKVPIAWAWTVDTWSQVTFCKLRVRLLPVAQLSIAPAKQDAVTMHRLYAKREYTHFR